MRINIAADIPADLADADEVLTRYGRWASDCDGRAKHRCGSAERAYRAEGRYGIESRRNPGPVIMPAAEAMACQRALARVADQERIVLAVLYVPKRLHPEAQLRMLRIPPKLSQERHLRGLRMFWNILKIMDGPARQAVDHLAPAPTMVRPTVTVALHAREFEETIP